MIKVFGLEEQASWVAALSKISPERKDIYFEPEYYSLYQNYGDGLAQCFVFENENGIAVYPFLKNLITPLGYELDKEYYDIQGAYGYNGLISSAVC